MSLISPASEAVGANALMTDRERQTALERISIRFSIQNLRTFPCIRIQEQRGRIALHGAWFDIELGELWIMDGQSGDFRRPSLG